MSEIVIISANDIHICDINPRSRIDDYKESILEKIEQIRLECSKQKADAFVIAGDLFNLKNPNKNPHGLVRELIEIFKKFSCPIYMIPGNHDLTGNNLESLKDQPLGVLFASGAITNLAQNSNPYKIIKDDLKVSLVGVPYFEDLDVSAITLPDKEDCIAQVCVLHQYAGPKSSMVFKEKLYGYDELATLGADVYIIGHYHVDQGIQKINDQHFVNIGSIGRGSLADENLEHQPKMGVTRFSKNGDQVIITTNTVNIKVKPAADVFDLIKRENEKKEMVDIQKFVEQLIIGTSTSNNSKISIEDMVKNLGVQKNVQDRTMHFILEAASKKK